MEVLAEGIYAYLHHLHMVVTFQFADYYYSNAISFKTHIPLFLTCVVMAGIAGPRHLIILSLLFASAPFLFRFCVSPDYGESLSFLSSSEKILCYSGIVIATFLAALISLHVALVSDQEKQLSMSSRKIFYFVIGALLLTSGGLMIGETGIRGWAEFSSEKPQWVGQHVANFMLLGMFATGAPALAGAIPSENVWRIFRTAVQLAVSISMALIAFRFAFIIWIEGIRWLSGSRF